MPVIFSEKLNARKRGKEHCDADPCLVSTDIVVVVVVVVVEKT